jgi:hypothetical protein
VVVWPLVRVANSVFAAVVRSERVLVAVMRSEMGLVAVVVPIFLQSVEVVA